MPIPFVKMHGAANDFVVIDHREQFLPETSAARTELFARLCDRRRGIGADGVLLLEHDPELDFAMRYYNADGGVADYCGNGARCLASLALGLGLGRAGAVRFRTAVGAQDARQGDGRIDVHFGSVREPGPPVVLEAAGRSFEGRVIRAGVPHFVTAVGRVDEVPIAEWAPPLRHHVTLGTEGVNVDFVAALGPNRFAMRTWERGVEGETLACGSGAIASALWAACEGAVSPVRIHTAGGDELEVTFRGIPGGWDVSLAGPAEIAFVGSWTERGAVVPGAATRGS